MKVWIETLKRKGGDKLAVKVVVNGEKKQSPRVQGKQRENSKSPVPGKYRKNSKSPVPGAIDWRRKKNVESLLQI